MFIKQNNGDFIYNGLPYNADQMDAITTENLVDDFAELCVHNVDQASIDALREELLKRLKEALT